MEKIIQIVRVDTIKSGISNNKDWTLYRVIDQDGVEYTTFSHFFSRNIGKEVIIEFIEEKHIDSGGKKYVYRKIISKKDLRDLLEENKNNNIKVSNVVSFLSEMKYNLLSARDRIEDVIDIINNKIEEENDNLIF